MTSHGADRQAGGPETQMICLIRIKGRLDPAWADWFEGLAVCTDENGDTVVSGQVSDQAALHGLLKKVRDLGMALLSFSCSEPGARS